MELLTLEEAKTISESHINKELGEVKNILFLPESHLKYEKGEPFLYSIGAKVTLPTGIKEYALNIDCFKSGEGVVCMYLCPNGYSAEDNPLDKAFNVTSIKPKKELTYTDENGNKLYGYSQRNLDQLCNLLKILLVILGCFLFAVIYVLYWLHSHDYLTRVLEAMV